MDQLPNDKIVLAAKGDTSAFAELVKTYQSMVYQTAFSILGERESALDVSQEVFIKVFRFLSGFHFESTFSTWLYRLTRNTALDRIRSERRKKSISMDMLEEQGFGVVDEDYTIDPACNLLLNEKKLLLHEAIGALSEDHRQVIRLAYFCQMSYDEIATAMGIELGTVKSRIYRAKQELRKFLEKRNYF